MDIIKNAMNFIPRTWRKRRETEVETEAKIQASTSMIPRTVQDLIGYGLPKRGSMGRSPPDQRDTQCRIRPEPSDTQRLGKATNSPRGVRSTRPSDLRHQNSIK